MCFLKYVLFLVLQEKVVAFESDPCGIEAIYGMHGFHGQQYARFDFTMFWNIALQWNPQPIAYCFKISTSDKSDFFLLVIGGIVRSQISAPAYAKSTTTRRSARRLVGCVTVLGKIQWWGWGIYRATEDRNTLLALLIVRWAMKAMWTTWQDLLRATKPSTCPRHLSEAPWMW